MRLPAMWTRRRAAWMTVAMDTSPRFLQNQVGAVADARALGGPEAHVHRHGHGPQQQAGVEGLGERNAGRQRNRNAISRPDATALQSVRARARGGMQLGVGA